MDLATTPFALERAQELRLDLKQNTPTPLTAFLEDYRPYRGSHRGLRAYETQILKPFIRTASRSQSILIQHGNLFRRRMVPEVPNFPQASALEKLRQKIFAVPNLDRSLEALDLASSNPTVPIKFEQNRRIRVNGRRLLWMLFISISGLSLFTACLIIFLAFFGIGRFASGDILSLDLRSCGGVQPRVQPCEITPNPDVAGIGVRYSSSDTIHTAIDIYRIQGRIALYMQTFLLAILLTFSPDGALSASWALVFTSTAFALSALIATATSQLTLYHVILVSKMQGLPIIILTIVELFPPRQRGPYIFLLHFFRLIISATVLAWYSVVAPCFGSQPKCNANVIAADYWSQGQAIAPARRVSSLSVVMFIFMVKFLQAVFFPENFKFAFLSLFSGGARKKWYGLPGGIPRENPTNWGKLCTWAIAGILDNNSTPPFVKLKVRLAPPTLPRPVTATTFHSSSPLPNRLQIVYQTASLNVRNALWYPKVWRLIIALGIGGLLVRSIEATISSNIVDVGENAWTYGQVMAVIMTTVPVIQVMQLVGLVPSPRNHTKGGHKEKVL